MYKTNKQMIMPWLINDGNNLEMRERSLQGCI